jgi:hypothetical protein
MRTRARSMRLLPVIAVMLASPLGGALLMVSASASYSRLGQTGGTRCDL